MPCRHAVAALAKMGLKAEDFVHKWLTMEAIRAIYTHCIKLVNSEEYWTPANAPRPLPPTIKRAANRPKIKRRADPVEREIITTKAKKTFVVTCSKCGQKGHYYKTCPNAAQDPNWKPMTKKERRVQKKTITHKSSTDPATSSDPAPNIAPAPNTDQSKARKAKKKLPKNQREEISVSQSAPPTEEAAGKNSNDNSPTVREKQQIVRPPTPSFVPPPIPTPGPTLWFKSQPSQAPNLMPHSSQLQSNDSIAGKTTTGTSHDAISEETMAAANSTTASRLLKFVPTPGYRPPGLRPPKQG
ncbi:hypothetical protein AHAS_Ahas02G0129200 [Arachis hypogaea]